ncbi:uncharacterized protein [Palaemon carinicauda]|uniref:uncharacterized protein isoform X3 n=1 Tax=Palaemon carinicauda TaxID=392227 RepID=UPI0035B6A09A
MEDFSTSPTLRRKMSFPNCSLLCLLILLQAGCGIHVDKVVVPAMVQLGGNATLECWYREDGDKLYSLKWWRGEDEFYQYLPPNRKHFRVAGVHVDMEATDYRNKHGPSGVETVVLDGVSLDTGGVFKCEILAENDFQTMYKVANMTVVHAPEDPPEIVMAANIPKDSIRVGQKLALNCSSPLANPPLSHSWYINSRRVNSSWVTKFPPRYRQYLAETISKLEFIVSEDLLLPGRILSVQCLATQRYPSPNQTHYSRNTVLNLKAREVPSFWEKMFNQGSNLVTFGQPVHCLFIFCTIAYVIPIVLFSPF